MSNETTLIITVLIITLIGVAIGPLPRLRMNRAGRRQCVHLLFGEYLKAGIPITLLTLLLGVVWLNFLF